MDVKKTIAIESIPIIMPEEDDDGVMELPISLAIDIPDVVVAGGPDTDMVMLISPMLEIDIDILLLSRPVVCRYHSRAHKIR